MHRLDGNNLPNNLKEPQKAEAATLPKVLITDNALNWLQTIGEGWATALKSLMRNDLDQWRKTVTELLGEFQVKGANTVYAFQICNATQVYLMRSAGEDLRVKGHRQPVLWLSPLGGWTKLDDVPVDVKVKQHKQVLAADTTHPGGLDPETTAMANSDIIRWSYC